VVQLLDAGDCPDFGPYLALELIQGKPVDGLLGKKGRLPIDQSVAVVVQLAQAVAYLHHRRIIHRDIKPGNVMISATPTGENVELIDFGIARAGEEATAAPPLTKLGQMIGTM